MRRLIAVWLLCLLPLLAACGTSAPAPAAAPTLKSGLTWTGTALTGLQFYQRKTEYAIIHYALPTSPDLVELVVEQVKSFRTMMQKQERAPRQRLVEIWLVPPGYAWPKGPLPPARFAWATGPGQVVMQTPLGPPGLEELNRQLYVAAFEGAGSPLFAVEWLQDAHAAAVLPEWLNFPVQIYRTATAWPAAAMLDELERKGPQAFRAATVLAALLVDRFGIGWTAHYPKRPDELTPALALQWATGTTSTDEALQRWDARIAAITRGTGSGAREASSHAADISPLRMEPALAALPQGANRSSIAYDLDLRVDPAAGLVAGEERLTWVNGEGVPIDALYFNLWANSERLALYGAAIRVLDVSVDGAPAAWAARGIDLAVPLGRPVPPGGQVAVTIRFTTALTGGLSQVPGLGADGRFFLGRFYPTLAVLDDRGWNLHPLHQKFGDPYLEPADFRVTVDVPAGTVLGGTGRLVSLDQRGDRQVYRYEATGVTEWGLAGGRRLVEVRGTEGGVAIVVLDADEKWAAKVLEGAREAVAFLQGVLGPMPNRHLVVTRGGGLELPGVVGVGELDEFGTWKNGLTHKLVHAWFGQYVTLDQWNEAWLDEGLARYLERRAARALGRERSAPAVRESDLPRHELISRSGTEFLRYGEYERMTVLLAPYPFEMLEQRLGVAGMDAVLRRFVRDYGGKVATGADFVRVAGAVAGQPLGDFFLAHRIDPAVRGSYKPLLPLGVAEP